MIRKLKSNEFDAVLHVINDAAEAYRCVIPEDRWKEPYMSAEELRNEVKSGVQFYGRVEENNIVAVMGMQYVKDLTLIRHAYVLRHSERELGKISLNTSCNCQINLKFWLELGRQLGGRYISTKRMVSFLNRKQRRIDF